jgi:cell division protein FtsQ
MNKPAGLVSSARSWRDIPQEVAPRSMSREGRRRLTMGFVKAGFALAAFACLAWAGWEVVQLWRHDPMKLAAPVKSDPLRTIKLTTNGVLDEEWVVETLALPRGVALMELDLEALQAQLLVDPQVRTAVLTRKFPDTLVVTLQERSPVVRLRVADRSGQPRDYLVARDGVVFPGVNYAPELVAALPWLDGVTLAPLARGGFAPVAGLETVADLLETAQINVPNLRRTWRVIGMDRFASYGEILVRTEHVREIVFGLRDDFFTQVALLDAVLAETRERPVGMINLSLGKKQVPVLFATEETAPATRPSPPAGPPGAAGARALPQGTGARVVPQGTGAGMAATGGAAKNSAGAAKVPRFTVSISSNPDS